MLALVGRGPTRTDIPAGYFGIGVLRPKYTKNIGTLWRSAHALGASFIFTIRDRFPPEARRNLVGADPALGHAQDTGPAWRSIPYLTFPSVAELRASVPLCTVVGVELADGAVDLPRFEHPDRAIYLLGSEIDGITAPAAAECDAVVRVPTRGSLNVAVTGAVVLYDRLAKGG